MLNCYIVLLLCNASHNNVSVKKSNDEHSETKMKERINKRIKIIPRQANLWVMLLLWLGSVSVGQAQNRPVQATMVFVPPYTLALSDYTSATSQKLNLSLLLRDAGSPLRPVKLRFTIEGAGITIRTSQAFLNSARPLPINLVPNIPTQLSGINQTFRQYFNPTNLEVLGLDRNEFLRSKRLPSGIYRWQLEILDYNLLVPLNNSQLSRQTIWMVLAQPPIVNLPQQNQKLRATNYGLQNVIFQWFNRSGSSPNSAFSTEYYVSLYEVYEPNNTRVTNAITAPRTLVYRNTLPLTNTTLIYNNTFPMLTPGKRYIFQVQARDRESRDLFENQGFSEAVVFQYGEECLPPTGIRAESPNTESIKLSWKGVPGTHTGYKIRYRPVGSGEDDWRLMTSQFNDLTITRLQPDREYEYEVSSVCGQLDGTNAARGTVKTRAPNPSNFVCGVPQGTYDMSDQEALGVLNQNDVVLVGGYRVKIRRATGSNGQFSGVGIAEVPLGNTKVKMKMGFRNVFINSSYRLLQGQMYAVRNKWRAMALATQVTVDAWRLAQDGRVEIRTNGSWKRLPTDGTQDYMLVDAKSGKKRFVDRNGRMDIPLDERDFSNLSPQEIVEAVKKLQEEADEAIEDGRYGDALELAAKAEELLKSVGKKVKEVVGFGKIVLAGLQSFKGTMQQEWQVIVDSLKADSTQVSKLAVDIRKNIAPSSNAPARNTTPNKPGFTNLIEDDEDQQTSDQTIIQRFKETSPLHSSYLELLKTYDKNRVKIYKVEIGLWLIAKYTQATELETLVEKIKKEAEALFKEYEQLKDTDKTEEEITQVLSPKIQAFLKKWYQTELKEMFK